MTEPVSVLITAIGGGGHGEQILKALRLADGGKYYIFGADMNPHCPQFALADVAMTLPRGTDPEYVDAVLDVCRRNAIRVVFHGCEPELKVMSRARARFAEADILLPINPPGVIETCMDKRATADFLQAAGFEPPRFVELHRPEDVGTVDWFPVIAKPSVGGGGSADCYIAQTPEQLRLLADYLELGTGWRQFFVQEYVGAPDAEFTVGVLHDLDGNFLNSIAVHRELKSQLNIRVRVPNRTGRRELGEQLVVSSGISHGRVDRYPEVTGPCERIAHALGVRGAINIQCRLVDGAVKVFEINPRFSGTTSIRALMGYNEPDVLIRHHLLGDAVAPRFPYRTGMVLRSLSETVVRETSVPSWRDV